MNTAAPVRADPALVQRRAAAPDASVWVAASAGTGKTKVLTDRVLALLLAGCPASRLLCLTFTKAAAAEMANRINEQLGGWAVAEEDALRATLATLTGAAPDDDTLTRARKLFAEALDVPGGLKIMTIHAFCESLISRFPLEAGIAPHFEVMDERTADETLRDAREAVLMRARHGGDEALAAALAEVTFWVDETQFTDVMAMLARERGRLHRLLEARGGADEAVAALADRLGVRPDETPDAIVAAACADGAFDAAGLRRACQAISDGSKTDIERGQMIAEWLTDPSQRAAGFDAYANAYLTNELKPRARLATKAVADVDPGVPDILAIEQARVLAVIERRRAALVLAATRALLTLSAAVLEAYEDHKRLRARLDYDDLILAARRLLERDRGASWVLFKLDGGIDHILIDEAQDTSPDQWAVVQSLAEEFFSGLGARERIRTVFAVGDAKQSIYSFQGADPGAFESMRAHFAARVAAAEERWDSIDLDISFRSTEAVLAAVDAVFARDEARGGVAPPDHPIHHDAWRIGQGGTVELWPAVVPTERDAVEPWSLPLSYEGEEAPLARLADVIAGRIRRWIDSGEMLESKNRPIRAGDVMVLVQRRGAFVEALVRALKQRDVPVAGVDRMTLTDQLAVKDLIALGRFLLLPEDDLTLAEVLKGPLFDIGEEGLFQLAHGRDGTLWDSLRRQRRADPAFGAAAATLADLLASVDYAAPFELYADVLGRRGGRNRILARLGLDAGDPLDEFLAQALAYEREHPPSLQGFLQWLGAGGVEIKRDLEQALRDEVRVMTVHGAKGLQAPIVFLADTLFSSRGGGGGAAPLHWIDDGHGGEIVVWPPRRAVQDPVSRAAHDAAAERQAQERRRLLYVAMTRAEDRLTVCGWHTRQSPAADCWYELVKAGLGDVAEEVEIDLTADSDLGWTGPGLRLHRGQSAAPEESRAAVALPPPAEVLPVWATTPAPAEEMPDKPLTPSAMPGDEPPVRSPLGSDGGEGFRRGRLIHTLLQHLPAIAPEDREAVARQYLARPVHGLAPDLQGDYAAEALAVLADPRFAPLAAPGARAEVALVGRVNGMLISGQVDRLVAADGRVTVVDYKTNRPPPQRIEDVPALYLRQMAAYRALLKKIYPDFSIDCALLWTDGPDFMALPGDLLDRHAP